MAKYGISKGFLGLNARNLLYIKEYNKVETIKFADSKLKSKHFLSARGIPVPKLFGVIKSHEELNKFDFGSLPSSFVLKPNKGSGGDGIIAFKERKGSTFYTVNDREVTLDELKTHISDIIDGGYSMNNTRDIAFFEQRIQTHHSLLKYSYQGLPDIRVIVYNMIPVMAMLRLPTRESGGRANLAQGALGVGIDLATGKPTYIAKKFKLINEIPEVGKFDKDFVIPFWDEILLVSSKCQQISNLGYLACDIALDENAGPILLELNARAGLKVQVANKAPLRKRLEQINDIKVKTPEKGVRVAKDLFGYKETKVNVPPHLKKTIIGLVENIEIYTTDNEAIKVMAKIDPNIAETVISPDLAKKIGEVNEQKTKIKLSIADVKLRTIVKIDNINDNYEIILGERDVHNFLIDPKKKANIETTSKLPKHSPNKSDQFYFVPSIDFGQVDFDIYEVSKSIKLLTRLTPTNLVEELDKFKKDATYNPQFEYKVNSELLIDLLQKIENIRVDDSNLGYLFDKKKIELANQIRMIERVGSEEFSNYANILFPKPSNEEVNNAKSMRKNYKYYRDLDTTKVNAKEVGKMLLEHLKKSNLNDWKIEFKPNMVSDCSVNKNNTIFVKPTAKFAKYRIEKLIAHEIETHIYTAENGKKQPYRLFQNGTANYLETQEGLAIYNQELALHIYPHSYFASGNVVANDIAINNSFANTVAKLIELGFEQSRALRTTMKCKRGLSDTSKTGGICKDSIYFRGAVKIDNFIKNGGKLEDLYYGKIALEDLDIIKSIKSLNAPQYLPNWY